MSITQLDPSILQGVRVAQLAASGRNTEQAAGNVPDEEVIQALIVRNMLRAERADEPRTSDTSASLDTTMASIANHLNAADIENDAKPGVKHDADHKRAGELSECHFYDADNRLVTLNRREAEAVLSFCRTFYPSE